MNLKQFLIRKLMLFFALSTLITVAVYILGVLFDPEADAVSVDRSRCTGSGFQEPRDRHIPIRSRAGNRRKRAGNLSSGLFDLLGGKLRRSQRDRPGTAGIPEASRR